MAKRESKPIIYDGEEFSSVRELADKHFNKNYNAAYQSVFRYNQRRRKRPVIWQKVEYASLAEMGRALGLSRERCRQLVNKEQEK